MLDPTTAQVLITLISTGGAIAVAWFNYRSQRPPDLPSGMKRPSSSVRPRARKTPKRTTKRT